MILLIYFINLYISLILINLYINAIYIITSRRKKKFEINISRENINHVYLITIFLIKKNVYNNIFISKYDLREH